MSIVADRRLLYERESGSKPVKHQGKEGQKLVLQSSLHYVFSPLSHSTSAEVYFFLILVYQV